MGATRSVISRLEEGGGARNRIQTLARVATALGRHLVLSFPVDMPERLEDAVQAARPLSLVSAAATNRRTIPVRHAPTGYFVSRDG